MKRVINVFFTATAVICVAIWANGQTTVSFPVGGGTIPVNPPDNNATGVSRTFTVSGIPTLNTQVDSVGLILAMNHTWIGDLRGTLTSPDGEVHTLFYDIGDANSPTGTGDSSNLLGSYLLVDSAATTLWTGALGGTSTFNIPPGNYRTTTINVNTATSMNTAYGYPGAPFAEREGKGLTPETAELTNGTWTLTISDNAAGDTGPINVGTALQVTYSAITAANASISGRLVSFEGHPIGNAEISITDANSGEVRVARSSPFGRFRVDDLAVGNTYIISVRDKRYLFADQLMMLEEDVVDLILTAMQFS